jgi:hypothetical protein
LQGLRGRLGVKVVPWDSGDVHGRTIWGREGAMGARNAEVSLGVADRGSAVSNLKLDVGRLALRKSDLYKYINN